jgi:hypothetical protein
MPVTVRARRASSAGQRKTIRLAWPEPYRLTIAADNPSFSWEVTFAATPASRVLSALAQRLSGQFLANESVLRVLGPVAGTLLGAGRLALTGTMPNRQTFHLVPSHVWMVTASRAQLGATDFGRPAPLPRQATIGDFRIPQKGLLAVGALDVDLINLGRHSTRTARS